MSPLESRLSEIKKSLEFLRDAKGEPIHFLIAHNYRDGSRVVEVQSPEFNLYPERIAELLIRSPFDAEFLLTQLERMRGALKEAEQCLDATIGAINDACSSRPAWTDTHRAALVWTTMVDAGVCRDLVRQALAGEQGGSDG